MNDERFFDLAMKVIVRQGTDAERAEFDALLASQPELKAEFARLQADVRTAKGALPLVNATEATAGELPAYARGRLQTKVRHTLGSPDTTKHRGWSWRWAIGLAATTSVIVLGLLLLNPSRPVIEVAMLDTAGGVRGAETNQVSLLQARWKEVRQFSNALESVAWERQPSARGDFAKIIYDPAAAEVRVSGRAGGKNFTTTIAVEKNLAGALDEAVHFARDQFGH